MSKDNLSPDLQAMVERRYPDDWTETDTRAVDTVRVLAADAVQNCGSGHPGTAMSLAPSPIRFTSAFSITTPMT